MLSWDYPRHNNLHDRIQRAQVYPITVMQTLTSSQIATLISYDIIICKDITDNPSVLRHLHLSQSKHEAVMQEATNITKGLK
jgi:hypothetical protein